MRSVSQTDAADYKDSKLYANSKIFVSQVGFEPTTPALKGRCSTG